MLYAVSVSQLQLWPQVIELQISTAEGVNDDKKNEHTEVLKLQNKSNTCRTFVAADSQYPVSFLFIIGNSLLSPTVAFLALFKHLKNTDSILKCQPEDCEVSLFCKLVIFAYCQTEAF